MGVVKDMTGQRFGCLTVVRRDGLSDRKYVNWLCKCDCGNTVVIDSGRLRDGSRRDCGCMRSSYDTCRYNEGVQCSGRFSGIERCKNCGWNPDVDKARKENR